MAAGAATIELTPEEAAERIERGDVSVVDVRTEEEHGAGHIAGDRLIPFDDLPARGAEIDSSRPVIFYCRSGERSGAAAEAFRASGREAASIGGGLLAWAEHGLPLDPQGGEVAHRSNLPGR
ncbi:MAG: rhodanese-like domain-containing protein [Actinobacteria bacterium]|nr:rhodanese-like domain-containing protein [Actinomycetota bacterium]